MAKREFEIINKFIENAIEHGNAILIGDSTLANKIHKKIMNLMQKESIDLENFRDLLYHQNESVRLWVATNLIKKGDKNAIEVLSELEKSNTIFSMNAKITLDMYKKAFYNQ